MNYYNEIKNKIIENEIYSKVKDYSKERNRVITYYEIGRLLNEAGGKYGENIINEYSKKLVIEVGKKYNERTLRRIRQYYRMFSDEKWSPVATKLTWSHYTELLPIRDKNKLLYYLNISIEQNLSRNELRNKIKSKEYERLDEKTKNKLISNEEYSIVDFVKNPILIKNNNNNNKVVDHFVELNKTILMTKGATKEIIDYKLSRYACYLIVQNGDSKKG